MHSQKAGISRGFCEPDGQNAGITKIVCEPLGRPQSADQKFVRARGPKNRNPEVEFRELRIVCESVPHGKWRGHFQNVRLNHMVIFFATCTVKMLEILVFCCNKWLSFRPVAHRNRRIWLVAILSWVFSWGNRGSSTRPGLESVAAVTGKTEICKKHGKLQK